MSNVAHVGDFCPYRDCPDFGKTDHGNLIKFGKTRQDKQRFRCKSCRKTFNENYGTLLHGKRTDEKDILETLALLAEGVRISSLHRTKGSRGRHHPQMASPSCRARRPTRRAPAQGLSHRARRVGRALELRPEQRSKKHYAETDETGQFWRSTMIETHTRLRVARGMGKTETEASTRVFETLKRRGHPEAPPPVISDGWGGIDEAMVAVYGQVPPYKGIGRPPTKKHPVDGWQYLQMVKQRDERGRVIGTELRVIFGEPEEVLAKLGSSTAYIERTHLTMRHMNGRLVRKGLGFSKLLSMHEAQAAWEDVVYNLGRTVKTLREEVQGDSSRRWRHRTPAMAASLTDHRWTVKELLTTLALPGHNNT